MSLIVFQVKLQGVLKVKFIETRNFMFLYI